MSTRQIILRILGAWLLVAIAIAASAQQNENRTNGNQPSAKKITVHFDPAQTEIHWSLGATMHTVHGTFKLKGGMIVFDPQTGEAQGEILIDLATGQSGSEARDSEMQKNILESAKYPQAIFHPQKVTGMANPGAIQNVTVEGTFTIHGQDHPLKLAMQTQINGHDAIAATKFAVPYVDWGMTDPSTFVLRVDKEVKVEVAAKGSVE